MKYPSIYVRFLFVCFVLGSSRVWSTLTVWIGFVVTVAVWFSKRFGFINEYAFEGQHQLTKNAALRYSRVLDTAKVSSCVFSSLLVFFPIHFHVRGSCYSFFDFLSQRARTRMHARTHTGGAGHCARKAVHDHERKTSGWHGGS